ncbi:uncharacterized protein LOC124450608 [Xenia sp. Carnegie-2017]|uniref:uncharacterized protein LOC124450608 n=1 Tax=Xenia sp. Carnegie-2017 TaxID=2897299 RepID=UPI001F047D04|nr:uncharacterized protein LOC124450608 [Xenia sp. Carnegie-2017]
MEEVLKMAVKIFALFFFIYSVNSGQVKFQNCDRNAPIQINKIDLPSPIEVKPGSKIATFVGYTNEYYAPTTNTEITWKVKVKRVVGWFSLDVSRFIPKHIPNSMKCADLQRALSSPLCPPVRGYRIFNRIFKISPSFQKSTINSYFASGNYKIDIDLHDKLTGKRILCVKNAEVKIEF